MPIHYYDPRAGIWKSIANPTPADIAEVLIASANNRPCEHCDADVEYDWSKGGSPDIVITHAPDCAA